MERKTSDKLRQRYWAEEREVKPRSDREYIPLEQREDQSWRDKVEILESGS